MSRGWNDSPNFLFEVLPGDSLHLLTTWVAVAETPNPKMSQLSSEGSQEKPVTDWIEERKGEELGSPWGPQTPGPTSP